MYDILGWHTLFDSQKEGLFIIERRRVDWPLYILGFWSVVQDMLINYKV